MQHGQAALLPCRHLQALSCPGSRVPCCPLQGRVAQGPREAADLLTAPCSTAVTQTQLQMRWHCHSPAAPPTSLPWHHSQPCCHLQQSIASHGGAGSPSSQRIALHPQPCCHLQRSIVSHWGTSTPAHSSMLYTHSPAALCAHLQLTRPCGQHCCPAGQDSQLPWSQHAQLPMPHLAHTQPCCH